MLRSLQKYLRSLQNLLRSLRILLRSLQNLLSSTTLDDEKRVKKQEKVMVFLNHHYKPSLLKLLLYNRLEAKVMDCGYFSIFEWKKFLSAFTHFYQFAEEGNNPLIYNNFCHYNQRR